MLAATLLAVLGLALLFVPSAHASHWNPPAWFNEAISGGTTHIDPNAAAETDCRFRRYEFQDGTHDEWLYCVKAYPGGYVDCRGRAFSSRGQQAYNCDLRRKLYANENEWHCTAHASTGFNAEQVEPWRRTTSAGAVSHDPGCLDRIKNNIPDDDRAGDRDGDGVPDDRDACPDTPGKGSADGCPGPDESLLTVYKSGTGSGRVTGPAGLACGDTGHKPLRLGEFPNPFRCSKNLARGSQVTLTATGFRAEPFMWSGPCAKLRAGVKSCTFTLTGDTTVAVHFLQKDEPFSLIQSFGKGKYRSMPAYDVYRCANRNYCWVIFNRKSTKIMSKEIKTGEWKRDNPMDALCDAISQSFSDPRGGLACSIAGFIPGLAASSIYRLRSLHSAAKHGGCMVYPIKNRSKPDWKRGIKVFPRGKNEHRSERRAFNGYCE